MPLEGGQKPRERGIIWARAPCGSAQEQEGSTKGSPAQTQPAPLICAQRTSKRHCLRSCLHIWGVLLPPCSLSRGAPACAGGHCPGSSAHVLRAILFLLPHHVETHSGTMAFPSASPHLSSSSTTQPLPSSQAQLQPITPWLLPGDMGGALPKVPNAPPLLPDPAVGLDLHPTSEAF